MPGDSHRFAANTLPGPGPRDRRIGVILDGDSDVLFTVWSRLGEIFATTKLLGRSWQSRLAIKPDESGMARYRRLSVFRCGTP